MEREFKGVWIPKEVWLNNELSLVEKALLAEIDSFSGDGKAFYKSKRNDSRRVQNQPTNDLESTQETRRDGVY